FNRGFVAGLTTTGETFVREAQRWFQHASIHELHVSRLDGDLAHFLESPFLSHIQVLEFAWFPLSDQEIMLFAQSPQVRNVRRLTIHSEGTISKDTVNAIATSPHLANLTHAKDHNWRSDVRLSSALQTRIKSNKRRKK